MPVEITETIPAALTNGTKKITYWTATVDSVSFDGETYEIPWQAAVDSGNHFFIVPVALARRMNAAFDPPAVFNPDGEEGPVYEVQCNATPPSGVSFEFGARLFHIDPLDLIYRDWDGNCFSTIAPSQPEAGIELLFLGSYFMKNVVIVFDYGNLEMRVADRIPYGISLPGPVATAEVQMQNVAALTSGVNWTTVSLALLCGAAALM